MVDAAGRDGDHRHCSARVPQRAREDLRGLARARYAILITIATSCDLVRACLDLFWSDRMCVLCHCVRMLGATTCKLSLRDKLDQPLQTVEVNRAELNQLQAGFGIMLQNLLPIRIPGFQIDARNAFDACVLVRYVGVMSSCQPHISRTESTCTSP